MHEAAMNGSIEFEVRESEVAVSFFSRVEDVKSLSRAQDLSVYVSDPLRDFHWRWDVMSVGRMAGEILSKQLFMPLVTLATVTSSLGQPADDVSEETLKTVGVISSLTVVVSLFCDP
jgi:hypothetical protein